MQSMYRVVVLWYSVRCCSMCTVNFMHMFQDNRQTTVLYLETLGSKPLPPMTKVPTCMDTSATREKEPSKQIAKNSPFHTLKIQQEISGGGSG